MTAQFSFHLTARVAGHRGALASLGLAFPAQAAAAISTAYGLRRIALHGPDPVRGALSARPTKPFSMLDDPRGQLHGAAQVRTRSSVTGARSG